MTNLNKFLFILTFFFIVFYFSPISVNLNEFPIDIQSLFENKEVKAQADITTGLIGHYKFDEGVGTTASDSAGNNNTGTLVNGPTWIAGKIGGAINFDGVDDFVSLGTPNQNIKDVWSGNTDFTMSVWFYANNLSATTSISDDLLSAYLSTGNQNRLFIYSGWGSEEIRFEVNNAWVTSAVGSGVDTNWQKNVWNNIVVTSSIINSSTSTARIYFNGQLTNSGDLTRNNFEPNSSSYQISDSANGNRDFNGLMDDVRIYNRALTQAEITELYNFSGTPPSSDTTPPVLSSSSPTGALPAGTTQTILSVEATDASSLVSCKYSQTSGTAYSSMTETLSTANGTTFTATVTGLTNGTSYNYYVRCQDIAGNANTTDYTISFSVASPPPPAGDTIPPTISVTSPTNGTTVSGIITITANASDNVGIAGVQFKLDTTTNLGTEDTTSPYSYSLNTATITDGSHTLTAVARDTSNNFTTSSIITITVNNASPPPPDTTPPSIPTGLITTPISSSQINLSWTASTDNVGVTGYKIYRCAGSACAPTAQIATSAINSYSNTGLTASTAYTYAVSAYDAAGNESGKSGSVSETTQAAPTSTNPIDNLKPGEWYMVPNSHLRDVAPCGGTVGGICNPVKNDPPQACYNSYAIYNFSHIIGGWNGGAFDTKRDRLLILGGGHGGWAGNDIYAFDLNTLKWKRVKDADCLSPADIISDITLEQTGYFIGAGGTIPDSQKPRTRHTYNYIQYVPGIDRFCSFGGAGFTRSGQTGANHVDCFNFETKQWEQIADMPAPANRNLIGMFSAVDPVTGHVWVRGNTYTSALMEFDPINNTWAVRNQNESNRSMINWTAAIDPKRRKFVAIGKAPSATVGEVYSWDIGASGIITRQTLTTTGATEIINSTNPGFQYDPVSDKFVAWNGGADVYTLDMDTLVWTRYAPAPTNTVIPTAAVSTGTYGRFRYIPSKNAFVVVNSVDQNVYIYKLSPSGGIQQDTTSPITPTNLTAIAVSSSQINLSWTASTDNVGVTGYKIYRCAGSGCTPTIQIATSVTNSYSDTGLTASTAYTYAVSAYDAAGNNSNQSTQVSIATLSQQIVSLNTKFSIGDKVQTTDNLNIRASPSITGILLGTQVLGSLGTIIGGPITADGYTWWQIDYDNTPDGWSAEDWLEKTVIQPSPPPTSGFSIPLTIEEPTGIARTNEPITSGIPLPQGTQTTNWSLWDGGVEVPLQVTKLQGRTPWILLDFQTSLPVNGIKTLTLKDIASTKSPPKSISITEDASQITVTTGPLKATINKTNFNLFEGVWLDRDQDNIYSATEQIITPQTDNIQIVDSITGTTFSGKGVPSSIAWEYQGKMRSTLKIDGSYQNYPNGLSYTTKITFYAGKTDIKIEHIIRNSYQTNERHIKIKSAVLRFGNGTVPVKAIRPGSISWTNADSQGTTFELVPATLWNIDTVTNNGMVIPDWSYHGATLIADFSEGLSFAEQTNRTNANKSSLFALAPGSWYSEYGELSTSKFSTLQDEKDAYTKWGWTWTASDEPVDQLATGPGKTIPDYAVSWRDVAVHGDTESDDLWQHNLMYLRTGQRSYWDRAVAWARYQKWEYAFRTDGFNYAWNSNYESPMVSRPAIAIPLTTADQSYLNGIYGATNGGRVDVLDWGADHFGGWGLIDYYYLTGDKDALEAAKDLGEISERVLGWQTPGSYTMAAGRVRRGARHLLLSTRLYEATQDPRWQNYMEHMAQLWLQSPDWDSRGMYDITDVRPIHIGFLAHALEWYYVVTGNALARDHLIAMAQWAKQYGLHSTYLYTGNYIHMDDPNTGGIWHGYFDGGDITTFYPEHTVTFIDMLVRGYRLTNDITLLDRAKFHWDRGSKGRYGDPTIRIAADNEVGRFMNSGFLSPRLYYTNNKGDLSYAHLLFYDYAHLGGSPDTTSPTTPTNLTANALSSSQINLSWTASTDNVGVAGYKIYRCAGSACALTAQIVTSATNSYSNTGLTASTAYTYAVLAYDAAGNESGKSSSVSAATPSPTPQCSDTIDNDSDGKIDFGGSSPDPDCSSLTDNNESDITPPQISSVISTTLASTTARIDWQTTNEPSTSQVEYGFTTQYGTATTLDATLTTSHSVLLSNLSPDNTTYNFRVRSKDSSNNEAISINNTFITPGLTDTVPPASTTNLTANNITQTSVDLVTWTAAGDDGNQGTAFQFDIRYATGELSENAWNDAGVIRATGEPTPKPAGSIMNYTLVGLTPNTTYKVALKTLDEVPNQSLISNIITFTTLKAEVAQTTPQTTTPSSTTSSSSGGSSSGGGGGSYTISDTTPPPQITDLESDGADKQTRLTWKNPVSSDYVRTIIVRKEITSATTTHSTSTKDGQVIYEGVGSEFTDIKLKNNQTYYYSIFTIDRTPNYSSPATTTVKTIEGKTSLEQIKQQPTPASLTGQGGERKSTTIKLFFQIKKGFFKRTLKQGMKGEDVKKLQEVLYENKEEFYDVCKTDAMSNKIQNPKSKNKTENKTKCDKKELTTGYFGNLTKLALIKFQEKYKDDILKPIGLTSGTGFFGKATVKKIEEMYEEKTESQIVNPKSQNANQDKTTKQLKSQTEDEQKAVLEQKVKELKTQLQELIKQLMEKIKGEMEGV